MATRDIVPREDSEGGIGTTLKRWAAGWFDAINGKDISSGILVDSDAAVTPTADKIPIASALGKLTAWIDAATTSIAGIVQLATTSESQAGTSTTKAVTPAALVAVLLAAIGIDPIDLPRNSDLGTAAYLDQTWLYASATWDASSVATAAQTSTTVAVPGAEIGDRVMPSASIALSGLNLRGEVTATDVVTLYLSNVTGSPVDLASATYYVAVLKRVATR